MMHQWKRVLETCDLTNEVQEGCDLSIESGRKVSTFAIPQGLRVLVATISLVAEESLKLVRAQTFVLLTESGTCVEDNEVRFDRVIAVFSSEVIKGG
jgi:hypothetical protein